MGELEDLLQHLWALAPDLASQGVRDAVTADIRSRCETGSSIVGACAALRVLLDRWLARERRPVIVFREWTGKGLWHYRVRFLEPGHYTAEAFQVYDLGTNSERVVDRWCAISIATLAAAQEQARQRALDLHSLEEQAERLSAAMGHDVRADVARLLDGPPMDPLGAKFQRMREAIEREAGRQAVESSVVVGEKAGDYSKLEEMTAQEFAARFRIVDDLVKDLPSAEQRAKMQAWLEEVLATRPGSGAVTGPGWRPSDAADLAARFTQTPDRPVDKDILFVVGPDESEAALRARVIAALGGRPAHGPGCPCIPCAGLRLDVDGSTGPVTFDPFAGRPTFGEALREIGANPEAVTQEQADDALLRAYGPTPGRIEGVRSTIAFETDFERAQRLAMNTSADRAFERMRPMNRLRREVLYQPKIEPAPRPDWPPRYSAKPKPPRPPKDPELRAQERAEQRQRKAARTARKSRRGFA
jgi:hypothetical protein